MNANVSVAYLFMLLLLGSCASQTRRSETEGRQTIPLFIGLEVDRSGNEPNANYSKRLADFGIESIRDRLITTFSAGEVVFEQQGIAANQYVSVRRPNPFLLVSDSSQAKLTLRLYIDGFRVVSDYTSEQQANKLLWGALANRPPKGLRTLVSLTATGEIPATRSNAFEFQVDGQSEAQEVERSATLNAVEVTEKKILDRLFEKRFLKTVKAAVELGK